MTLWQKILLFAVTILTLYAVVFAEPLLRPLHLIAGVAWFGMVFFINVILIPSTQAMDDAAKYNLLVELFPRVFDAATVVSTVAVFSGVRLLILHYGLRLDLLFIQLRGLTLLIGSLMAVGLYLFHLTLESREMAVIKKIRDDPERRLTPEAKQLLQRLQIVPRVGFLIMLTILVLMVYSVHPILT